MAPCYNVFVRNRRTRYCFRLLFFVLIALFFYACHRDSAQAKNSLSVSIPHELSTLDPLAKDIVGQFAIASHFYEPLVRIDGEMKIQPCLAKSWESPDLSTWIFHLQPSVKFHDGKSLTARDVVYSFQRLVDEPDLEMRAYISNLAEIKALGSLTVQMKTRAPLYAFLNKLGFVLIVPEGVESHDIAEKVNGTGPYKLDRWEKGVSISMIRNEGYWQSKPQLERVTFYLNRSPQEAVQDLLAGKCQLAQGNIRQLENRIRQSSEHEILVRDSVFIKYLSLDLLHDESPFCSVKKSNPFRNKQVRQAIHLAIDRRALAKQLPEYVTPATQTLPPFVFGFNPDIPEAPYDPTRSRQLLAQAGFPNGFDVTIHTRELYRQTASVVQSQLRQIGIRCQVQILPTSEFYDAQERHRFSLLVGGFGCTTGDASDLLDGAMHSIDPARNYGGSNSGGYSNEEVDRAIERSASILRTEDRRQILQDIMKRLMDDLPWIPLCIDQEAYAIDRRFDWQPRSDSFVLAQEVRLRKTK